MSIRFLPVATGVFLALTAVASARDCRQGNQIGSSYGSTGINAVAPSQAVMNPCSSMYGFGARRPQVRRHRHRLHR